MKKTLTLIIGLMSALFIEAQGFVFQLQGQPLADGETITFSAEEDLFGDLSCETNNVMNPTDGLMLKLLNTPIVTASATLQISYNSLNADILQWCMGGECTPFNNQSSLTKRFTVEGETQVQFDAVGIHSEGYLKATLNVNIGLESHKVNIVFTNGDVDGIKPLSQRTSEERAIYDFHGRKVQGQLSHGIYLVEDGEHIRKTIIK